METYIRIDAALKSALHRISVLQAAVPNHQQSVVEHRLHGTAQASIITTWAFAHAYDLCHCEVALLTVLISAALNSLQRMPKISRARLSLSLNNPKHHTPLGSRLSVQRDTLTQYISPRGGHLRSVSLAHTYID